MIEFLTDEEVAQLTDEEKEIYRKGVRYSESEHAGSYDGWAQGYKLLESIGFERVEAVAGHRGFVSLRKPERFRTAMQANDAGESDG